MKKRCSICKRKRPLSDFNKNSRRKDGLQTKCRECSKKKSRTYYATNGDKMRKQIAKTRKAKKQENQQKLYEYLTEHPCIDCGDQDPVVLEFDHKSSATKTVNISLALNRGWSWKRIETEIKKCDVRCANCHRRKTARDQKWFTWKMSRAA